MNSKLRGYLELVRLPNLVTAAADVLAGFVCNGGEPIRWATCLTLAVSSMCLYAGGVALNDVCDAEPDRVERPNRPIPAGRVSRRAGFQAAVLLLLVGMGLAAAVSLVAALVAVALIAAIVLYDVVLKSTHAAPALMGTCRALNLALGMVGAATIVAPHAMVAIGLMWLYVSSVTFFARDEAGISSPWRLGVGLCGIALAVVGLLPLTFLSPQHDSTGAVLIFTLLVIVASRGRHAMSLRTPQAVQRAVKAFVLGLILFDSAIAWMGAGWDGAVFVAAFLVPARALSRMFRVT